MYKHSYPVIVQSILSYSNKTQIHIFIKKLHVFYTRQLLKAILNPLQVCMAVSSGQSEEHLNKSISKLAHQLWPIFSSMSVDLGGIILFWKYSTGLSFKWPWVVSKWCCSFDGFIDSFDSTVEQMTHIGNFMPSVSLKVNPNLRYLYIFGSSLICAYPY